MSIAFGLIARSLAFLSMFASPMHLASAQTPTQRDHNTIKIVGDVRATTIWPNNWPLGEAAIGSSQVQ